MRIYVQRPNPLDLGSESRSLIESGGWSEVGVILLDHPAGPPTECATFAGQLLCIKGRDCPRTSKGTEVKNNEELEPPIGCL